MNSDKLLDRVTSLALAKVKVQQSNVFEQVNNQLESYLANNLEEKIATELTSHLDLDLRTKAINFLDDEILKLVNGGIEKEDLPDKSDKPNSKIPSPPSNKNDPVKNNGNGKTIKQKVHEFLIKNCTKKYAVPEIVDELEENYNSIYSALSYLREEGSVKKVGKLWTISESEDPQEDQEKITSKEKYEELPYIKAVRSILSYLNRNGEILTNKLYNDLSDHKKADLRHAIHVLKNNEVLTELSNAKDMHNPSIKIRPDFETDEREEQLGPLLTKICRQILEA